jgi:glycosyltransferase involved in cell wall biosynthesis
VIGLRLLLTTYYFPPVAGVGVERTLKHVTYLPEQGWQPVVIGPGNPGYRLVDPASVARIPPGTELHQAFAVEPAHIRQLGRWLGNAARGIWPISNDLTTDDGRMEAESATDQGGSGGSHLRDALNDAWAWLIPRTFFPDEQLLWVPAAVAVALRVHQLSPVDAIYSSSPPVSSHLAAAVVASLTGLPWVADFRDPWVGNAFNRALTPVHENLRNSLERLIVRSAARTVFATAALRDAYARRYPALGGRFVTITNGYDADELADLARELPAGGGDGSRPFQLVYAGSVYGDRELEVFLDGVERLLAARPQLRDELRIEFIGWWSTANERLAASRLPRLAPVVRHSAQVSRSAALARVAAADAGLLLLAGGPDRDLFVGAKLFDYLGLDRPVLAVAPPGEIRQILSGLDWGVAVDPTPADVARGLEAIIAAGPPSHPADPERRFERRRLTAQLASLLDEVASARPA